MSTYTPPKGWEEIETYLSLMGYWDWSRSETISYIEGLDVRDPEDKIMLLYLFKKAPDLEARLVAGKKLDYFNATF